MECKMKSCPNISTVKYQELNLVPRAFAFPNFKGKGSGNEVDQELTFKACHPKLSNSLTMDQLQLVPEVSYLIFPENLDPKGDDDSDAESGLGLAEQVLVIIELYM